ncbi:MAG: hypothetical protein JWR80_7076 [Bradyrhizobium sp.]|nr:hypothetical protein [Bradyrhizobium sp.]
MYSRAGLSRTVTLVVALPLTAVSTGGVARAFDAADTTGEDLNRSNVAGALIGTYVPAHMEADTAPVSHHRTSARGYGSVRFEAALSGIHAKVPRDGVADRTNSQGGVS